jgi:hypothetical protein
MTLHTRRIVAEVPRSFIGGEGSRHLTGPFAA